MENAFITLLVIFILLFIIIIYLFLIKNKTKSNFNNIYYKKLFFLRKSKLKFLKKISILENEYVIIPKLYLKKIIKTDNKKYKNILKNMTVDYAIFNKDYYQIILLIELSYESDTDNNRDKIDKLKMICNDAGIKFMTFEANNKMNENEIIDKIRQILKNNSI